VAVEELLKKLAENDTRIAALLAKDELTDEDRAEYERLSAEYKRLAEQIDRKRQLVAHNAETERIIASARQTEALIEAGRRREAATVSAVPVGAGRVSDAAGPAPSRQRTDDQGRVTAYFEDTDEVLNLRFGESADAHRRLSYKQEKRQNVELLKSLGYVPWGVFKDLRDFVRSGLDGHQTSHFRDRVGRHYAVVVGMSEGVGSEGGYTVMPEFAGGIIDRIYANPLWGLTDNYSVSGNNLTFLANAETSRAAGSRHGGMRGYWLPEGGTLTASKPTLREVTLKLIKLGVLVYLTQELIDDGGSAMMTYVARKAAEEFNFMIGDALVNDDWNPVVWAKVT